MSELEAALAGWRSDGGWRVDPARFHFIEALARRLPGQPAPVRRLLQDRLQAALTDYAVRVAQAQPPVTLPPRAACAPLAQLNQSLRDRASQGQDELASARRFRRAWASGRTLDQVRQAAARQPANAGPLNSHALVLQSLAWLGELSPDYLRRFVAHVESLQWLEQAREKPARPARRSRPKA